MQILSLAYTASCICLRSKICTDKKNLNFLKQSKLWKSLIMNKSLSSRIIGYVSSLIFTLTAFIIIIYPEFFPFGKEMNIVFLLVLACLQFVAQSICFLHVVGDKGPRWNLVVYLSTLSVVLIIVLFTMWVMARLDYRMMM